MRCIYKPVITIATLYCTVMHVDLITEDIPIATHVVHVRIHE